MSKTVRLQIPPFLWTLKTQRCLLWCWQAGLGIGKRLAPEVLFYGLKNSTLAINRRQRVPVSARVLWTPETLAQPARAVLGGIDPDVGFTQI